MLEMAIKSTGDFKQYLTDFIKCVRKLKPKKFNQFVASAVLVFSRANLNI